MISGRRGGRGSEEWKTGLYCCGVGTSTPMPSSGQDMIPTFSISNCQLPLLLSEVGVSCEVHDPLPGTYDNAPMPGTMKQPLAEAVGRKAVGKDDLRRRGDRKTRDDWKPSASWLFAIILKRFKTVRVTIIGYDGLPSCKIIRKIFYSCDGLDGGVRLIQTRLSFVGVPATRVFGST